MKLIGGVCVVLTLTTSSTLAQPGRNTAVAIQQLAATTTHFATFDIVANRTPDRQAPADLHEGHRRLLEGLRQASLDPAGLQAMLDSPDPAVRTLALGGLFIREDPRDLPFIARLLGDTAPTIRQLRSPAAAGGLVPRRAFEAPQTVGDVARAMIASYLHASDLDPNGRKPAEIPALFNGYWAERRGRRHTAGWLLVRMRRATRQISTLRPEYRADVDRVLGEINALPQEERAWTLLFVRTGVSNDDEPADRSIVDALRGVGRDAIWRFLDGESPTDDPDLKQDRLRFASRAWAMIHFILDRAPMLLSPDDADRVRQIAARFRGIEGPEAFIAASARLRALTDPRRAGDDIRDAITSGTSDRQYPGLQGRLVATLWQVRGAEERGFLANWLYSALPLRLGDEAVRGFFQSVEQEARPDTKDLVAAVVSDARFETAPWSLLAPLLGAANRGLPTPLVARSAIANADPRPPKPDHEAVLASWRSLLREYVGQPR